MNKPRPRPEKRMLEGVGRLRNNTDFVVLKKHLEEELEYWKQALVEQADSASFSQIQGRARQLQDILKYINPEV